MKLETPRITHDSRRFSKESVDSQTNLVMLVPMAAKALDTAPYGAVIKERLRRTGATLDEHTPFVTELPNSRGTRVAIARVDPAKSTFETLTLARRLIAAHSGTRPGVIAIACHGLPASTAERICEAIVAAAAAAWFELPSFKSKKTKVRRLPTLRFCGDAPKRDYRRTLAAAHGNNLARYLTALPPNELTPRTYRQHVLRLARAHGWKARFLGVPALKRLGAGAFLAVAQGSPQADAGILRLRYTPKRGARGAPVALVGKGICFDTGGTNLKPARHMHGMHEDMEGSAVALGTLLALTEMKVDFPVDCWLALAQNHIGPQAYKQNDVVRAANGKTIEVMHTDAEGRMVLADTLFLASKQKPRLIVDYATLTGACVAALSTRMSGAFTNRAGWAADLIAAGDESGERVWPFPLPEDYRSSLKSSIADIKQCTLDNDADHILAAVFLKEFLDGDPSWVHIDLAAGNHKGGLAHIPTDITAFGVRFTLSFLLDHKRR